MFSSDITASDDASKPASSSSLMSSIFGSGNRSDADKINDPKIGKDANNNDEDASSLFGSRISSKINKEIRQKQKKRRMNESDGLNKKEKETGNCHRSSREEILKIRRQQATNPVVDMVVLHQEESAPKFAFAEDVNACLRTHGVAVLPQVISLSKLEELTDVATRWKTLICDSLSKRRLDWNTSDASELENIRFWEMAARCKGRMDVRYIDGGRQLADAGEAATAAGSKVPSSSSPFWQKHSLLNSIVHTVLYGGEPEDHAPRLVYAGWIFSFPGSDSQPWHQDGMPLFPRGCESLPAAYAINVFIPLEDSDGSIESGPTEFVVGSHCMTEKAAMDLVSQREEEVSGTNDDLGDHPPSQEKCQSQVISPILKRGDMLIYDYRICHRGTANINKPSTQAQQQPRKILYLMFARPWFQEHMNFGTEKLFPEE